jgi:hypothetical protein
MNEHQSYHHAWGAFRSHVCVVLFIASDQSD